jgi:FMN-dependent NADH-azoreductase
LFRLDASFRTEGSVSRAIADLVEHAWSEERPGDPVVRRHLGADPIQATAWGDAVTAGYLPDEARTPAQREAAELATTLVDELADAEALLFAVPLYNWGVSQHFKAYVDLVMTEPRMAPGTTTLAGKPAELVVVRGGNYQPGAPRAGWDHATPYMRRILEDVWGLDLAVVETDFALVGVVPALDEFRELAAEMRERSERLAREHGALLGRRVPTGAS